MTSYDVVRYFKKNLPQGYGKIGHFGTLDPFASGVLMIGIAGAARLNDYIHEHCPKTYLAIGKLGERTDSGDYTGNKIATDDSAYLSERIKSFDKEFLQATLSEKFVGTYWQTPPVFSATKFQGKPLHEWARQGVKITKEPVKREILRLSVKKYHFPYLAFEVQVSSGTYIRTLFEDMAQWLGSYGHLIALQRLAVGKVAASSGLLKKDWPRADWDLSEFSLCPTQVLPFPQRELSQEEFQRLRHGQSLKGSDDKEGLSWLVYQNHLAGLSTLNREECKVIVNYSVNLSC